MHILQSLFFVHILEACSQLKLVKNRKGKQDTIEFLGLLQSDQLLVEAPLTTTREEYSKTCALTLIDMPKPSALRPCVGVTFARRKEVRKEIMPSLS